ncbi:hypothetical protein E4T44_00165 [Aureobasidium sp. EXF-8845]|nr:hypothetical protein E4T44_00165 [Aureobasidium sp. EXF-8845]KAI4858293.1 hypothetical protein E4T45_00198 [Aureobasidium sp. EXF-8846]
MRLESPAPPGTPTRYNLLRPLLLLLYATAFAIRTVVECVRTSHLDKLSSVAAFKKVWFARFWAWLGPRNREGAAEHVVPLLKRARGICLDVGPGTGEWLDLYALAQNPHVSKIYGIEPNHELHAALEASVRKAGLSDIYEIIGCGVEELSNRTELADASVDTIITVQCLCSVSMPRKTISELYLLLRPEGQWLVYEHVKTRYNGYLVDYWQRILDFVWPHFLNGCELCRPTDMWLLNAGPWKAIDLAPLTGEGPYNAIPSVLGSLTK